MNGMKLRSLKPLSPRRARIKAAFMSLALAGALASASTASAGTTTAFGPKRYIRTSGPPQTFTETFSRCGTAPFQIVLVNGNADGTKRISSAFVYLNGVQIFSPADLNQQVARIARSVVLRDQNQLTIKLASNPGSFVIIDVEYAASPVALSTGGEGASLLDPTMLLSAVSIVNHGLAAAE